MGLVITRDESAADLILEVDHDVLTKYVYTAVDPRSKTPAFKSTIARVIASSIAMDPKVQLTISGGKERREKAALKAC